MPAEFAIEARNLEKRFPKARRWRDLVRLRPPEWVDALRGLSLEVPRGRIHGLLGANGAGKTTLLKVLATLVVPNAGTARVAGFDVASEGARVRERLGFVVAEERSFYWRLSGRDNLLFFAALHDMAGAARRRRVDELLDLVGLHEKAARPYREYSSGMRQRLSIARGLLGMPEILLMDEPTRALDPPSAGWIRKFVRDRLCREQGTTVLLATHDLLEAATTCDTLSLVEGGRLVATGTPDEIRRPLDGSRRTAITLLPPHDVVRSDLDAAEPQADGTLRMVVQGSPEDVASRVRELVTSGARVAAVEPLEADLAALFERLAAAGAGARMKNFLRRSWAFVVRDFRAETSYRLAFAMQLLGLLGMLVTFRLVATLIGPGVPALQRYGGNFFTYVLLGYAPLEYLRVGIMGFSRSVREAQAFGTLEALLVTRAGIPTIIFGSVLYDYARATLRAVLFIGVASAASGQLRALDIPAALAFLALSIPCFAALGILSASFVMVFKKGDPISLLFVGTSTLLGGLLFPTEMLGRFEAISRWLPLTYAMEGVRQAAEGHPLRQLGSQLLPLAAFSVVLVPLAAWSFRAALDRARRDGTLSHY